MLIIDDDYKFGIFWEVLSKENEFYYGTMMFIIDDEIFPKKVAFNHTLDTIFFNLKQSANDLYHPAEKNNGELGSNTVDNRKLSYGKVPNIISLNTSELGMAYTGWDGYGGISLQLGFNEDTERLFYSEDNGNNFKEIVLKKGTIQNIFEMLPDNVALEAQLPKT